LAAQKVSMGTNLLCDRFWGMHGPHTITKQLPKYPGSKYFNRAVSKNSAIEWSNTFYYYFVSTLVYAGLA